MAKCWPVGCLFLLATQCTYSAGVLTIVSNMRSSAHNSEEKKPIVEVSSVALFLHPSPAFRGFGLPSTGKTLSTGESSKTPQAAAVGDADADLEARLDNLRRQ
ncbi:charged multivesicular body protein 2a-like [Elysia marginata]|uniref:Charged multivesicular body protein 2a-like n=1 Tax=Elysia marginata TaxID=1093978 RepID=A0AAV4FVI1_9GAST|nr:charged multivesicular body protein 2a-like [Elysia marginata]